MTLAEETVPAGEADIIADLVKTNLKTTGRDGAVTKRGQHAKHHGCVDGIFRITGDLPADMRVGIFEPGATYRCVVRFSNGGQRDDRKADVRGMAIKLLDVPGEKLLPGHGNARELDMLLVDHPTYFTATMSDYCAFNRYFTPVQALSANGMSPGRILHAAWGLVHLVLGHRRLFSAARGFAGRRARSVLDLTYHSTVPFLLGQNRAVKYKAIPQGGPTKAGDQGPQGGDFLRETLWAHLDRHPVQVDFGVVVQTCAVRHPVEDPSVDWEANDAAFVKLAELVLPRQTNSPAKDRDAEILRFHPWMTLPAHRPLGHINRARRAIYLAMADKRRQGQNGSR